MWMKNTTLMKKQHYYFINKKEYNMIEPMFGYIWEIPFILGILCGMLLFGLISYSIDRYNKWKESLRKAEQYYNGRWKS